MLEERAHDLALTCSELLRSGNDFPTVWDTKLKGHNLVIGTPRQRLEGIQPILEIPLITGERLIFYADGRNFRVK
jgi:hypothetical protein